MDAFHRSQRISYVLIHNDCYKDVDPAEVNLLQRKMVFSPFITCALSMVVNVVSVRRRKFQFAGSTELIRELKLIYSIIFGSLLVGLGPGFYYFCKYTECLDSLVALGARQDWLTAEDYKMIEDEEYFLSHADLRIDRERYLSEYVKKNIDGAS